MTPAPSLSTPIARRRADPAELLLMTAASMAALMIPSALAQSIDPRLINEASVWDKPLKFEASLIVHLVTMALVLRALPSERRDGRISRGIALTTAFFALTEVLYLIIQSARGRASHFNTETPVESIMYSIMGVGAVSLVIGSFVWGVMVWRHASDTTGPGTRLGVGLGLTLGSVMTLVIAGLMSSGAIDGPGHWVGGIRSDANGLPLVGWSATGGDLRVPHFFATHTMQAVPLLGLIADRLAPGQARAIVIGGAALSVLVVAGLFLQALAGQPLVRL